MNRNVRFLERCNSCSGAIKLASLTTALHAFEFRLIYGLSMKAFNSKRNKTCGVSLWQHHNGIVNDSAG